MDLPKMKLSKEAQEVFDYRNRFMIRTGKYPHMRIAQMSLGSKVYNEGRKELVDKGMWKKNKKGELVPNVKPDYIWRGRSN